MLHQLRWYNIIDKVQEFFMIIRHRRRTNAKPEIIPVNQPEKKVSILITPARVISSLRAWSSPFIMVKLRD